MPTYDYFCPENGVTVTLEHGMKDRVQNWGELCQRTGRELGSTPAQTDVERIISGGLLSMVPGSASPPATPCSSHCACHPH